MNNSTFEYGSELQGRGEPTKEDLFIGGSIFTMAILTIFLSFVNLYFIKKVEIFHNAFGWLWASRTIAEMLVEMNHAVYNAPMTLFQPVDIPPIVGIIPYFIMYVGAVCSCLVHEIISVNRFVAVYSTVQYKIIFSKRNCLTLIALCWIYCIVSAPIYAVFPCNLIGYSPTLYEYVFVQCTPDLDRHISIVGTTMNIFCMVLCSFTLVTDFFTLLKIIKIRKALSLLNNEKHFRRDVRFFIQSAVQNVFMIFVVIMIVYANNRNIPENKAVNILGFSTMSLLHVVNALSLIVFNPEIRGRLLGRAQASSSQVQPSVTHIGHVRKSVYPPSHSRV